MTDEVFPTPIGSEDRKTLELCGCDASGALCVLDKGHEGPCQRLGTTTAVRHDADRERSR
jgi:hypothetical protein